MPSTTPSNPTLPPLPTTHLKPRTLMPLPQPPRCIKPLLTMRPTAATNFITHKPSAGVRTAIPKSLREPFRLAQGIHTTPLPLSRHIYIFFTTFCSCTYTLQTLPSQPSKATKQANHIFHFVFSLSFVLFPPSFSLHLLHLLLNLTQGSSMYFLSLHAT